MKVFHLINEQGNPLIHGWGEYFVTDCENYARQIIRAYTGILHLTLEEGNPYKKENK